MTTIYGIDVSSYQNGIDFGEVAREGFSFVIVKATEGDNYTNPYYTSMVQASINAGLYTMSYHFVHSADENGQVARIEQYCRKDLPLWLDSEVDGSGEYTVSVDLVRRLRADGWNVVGAYLPKWFWSQIGSPDLRPLGAEWASGYPGGSGTASGIYASIGGDNASGWSPYGNVAPSLYQFTDKATVAGHSVDASAFKGTLQQLKDLTSMAITQDDANLIATTILEYAVARQGDGQTGSTNLHAVLAWSDANSITARNDVKASLGSKIDSVAAPQNDQLAKIVSNTTPPLQVNATAQVDPTVLQNAVQAAVQALVPAIAQAVQAALDTERDAQLGALGYHKS